MKQILLIVIMIWGSTLSYCQSIKPDVITTSGNVDATSNNSVSWTIGECITETFSDAGNKLTQGYQQGNYDVSTLVDNTGNLIKIVLYPNPATDYVYLEIQLQDIFGSYFQLYDLNGRCLINEKINSEKTEIWLGSYSSNAYILNVYAANKKLLKSFKIIKNK